MAIKNPFTNISDAFLNFQELYGENTKEQQDRYIEAFEKFKKIFNLNNAYVASSSGRVEVCGNHTDHNGGKVVCCAISLDSVAMFLPTDDNIIHVYSEGHSEIIVDINSNENTKKGTSTALVKGVVVGLKNNNYKVGGFKAYITSNVIGGAGISSSASFELLITEILNFLYNNSKISKEEKALISQFSEREFFGKPCGLLDQSAISYGGLKMMDFSEEGKIKVSEINNSLKDYTLILVNTGGSHANLTDEYASIPNEMFAVAKAFGKKKLISISENEFFEKIGDFYNKLPDRAISRAIHFFNENKRVEKIYGALNNNDYETFLNCVRKSGISSAIKLQNCFVPSSNEQPILKALAVCEEFLNGGANRIHGGGFAGCILNIVKNDDVKYFIDSISRFFSKDAIIPLKVRSVGTKVL